MLTPIPEEMNTVYASNTPRKSHSCILRCNCCQVVAFRHVDVLVIQSSQLGTEMMKKRGQCSNRNTGKHRHCVQVSPSSKDEESTQYFDLQAPADVANVHADPENLQDSIRRGSESWQGWTEIQSMAL